ncbi:MAG TPA: aminotransferase class IV [Vicinamibacterales bacterium]
MDIAVNIDGRLRSRDEAVVSVFDHGFLFGEGVYEVLRTYGRKPFLLERHMERLRASADRIALQIPLSDEELRARIDETLAAASLPGEAYVRLVVTRGVGEIVYDPAACPAPTTVIIVKPLQALKPSVYTEGVRVALVPVMRNHPSSVDPRIKSNNLLNNALAMQQAYARGAFEALMRNHRGEICEGAQSNFFLVTNGVVRTPPLTAGLLAGITRGLVLELAAARGLHVREEPLDESDLAAADEAFLTSTTKEIVPVVAVDALEIGNGTPGPITLQLLDAFRERTQRG